MIRSQAAQAAHARSFITHKRGQVTGYSRASKTRFRREIWAIYEALAALGPNNPRSGFWTLTLPGDNSGWEEMDHRRCFQAFRAALKRRFPRSFGFWCKEYQRRGAAHYHGLLLFDQFDLDGLPDWWIERKIRGELWYEQAQSHPAEDWLRRTWARILGQPAWTEIKPVRELRSDYLAKESSKTLSKAAPGNTGRWWGLINKAAVREAQRVYSREPTPSELDEFDRRRDAYWAGPLDRLGKRHGWDHKPQPPNWLPSSYDYDQPVPPRRSLDTSDILPISTDRIGQKSAPLPPLRIPLPVRMRRSLTR